MLIKSFKPPILGKIPLFLQTKIYESMCTFSEARKQKLGNALIFLATHTSKDLSKTKALKLLYLIEERMSLQYHVPFLGLPFEIWQAGPVAKDVYIDLTEGPVLLKDFIQMRCGEREDRYIVPLKEFDDSEFSECEIQVMQDVVNKYGHMTAKQLVNETHKPNSLWYRIAKENNILDDLLNQKSNSSDKMIDFTKDMTQCASDYYNESLALHQTANILMGSQSV